MKSESIPASLAVLTTPKRTLQTADLSDELTSLPGAPSTQFVTTQAGLEQSLRLAPSHIDSAMARLEIEEQNERSSSCDDYVMPAPLERNMMRKRLSQIVSSAIRTLRRDAHGQVGGSGAVVMFSASEVGEARYKRMKAGFTQLKEHLTKVDEHRKQLQLGLDRLQADTMILQQTWPFLIKPVSNIATDLSESCSILDEFKNTLEQVVAKQTGVKLAELQLFEEKLQVREQLRHQANETEKRLHTLRTSLNRVHRHQPKSKLNETMREIAAKRQEFKRLRRRLAVMTEALEHVFQFYFQLDQCIAEPELETVQDQLQSFFEQNQRIFEAIQPQLLDL